MMDDCGYNSVYKCAYTNYRVFVVPCLSPGDVYTAYSVSLGSNYMYLRAKFK